MLITIVAWFTSTLLYSIVAISISRSMQKYPITQTRCIPEGRFSDTAECVSDFAPTTKICGWISSD